jgi:DNA polymerase/3'-5' exonuclease PolX
VASWAKASQLVMTARQIEGENQFCVRAYRCAARTIEGLLQSLRNLTAAHEDLSELPNILSRFWYCDFSKWWTPIDDHYIRLCGGPI